jgi:hypothetical protein
MIINILFFLFLYSYGSTPKPNAPSRDEEEKSLSHLFTGKEKEYFILRYKSLQRFYTDNFSHFYNTALSLQKDELERLLLKDEYFHVFSERNMTDERLIVEISVFFNSLIDSKKDSHDSQKEIEISQKKALLKQYLPGIFYELLYVKITPYTSDYFFSIKHFHLK